MPWRPEINAVVKDALDKALKSIEEILTPEEKANGQYGKAELILGMLEWVDSPDDLLYVPDDRLKEKLERYKTSFTGKSKKELKEKGDLMEQIALIAFTCLKGWDYVKSYPSYSEQHDLVIGGSTPLWERSSKSILGTDERLTIVIEAKYLNKPLNSAQFTRLCYILQNKFDKSSCLGVFLSDKGATGMERSQSLHDTKAAQVIFHARTGKYVVVLDRNDILTLDKPGSLVRILRAKIRDVEASADISLGQHDHLQWIEVKLPPHLTQFVKHVPLNPSNSD